MIIKITVDATAGKVNAVIGAVESKGKKVRIMLNQTAQIQVGINKIILLLTDGHRIGQKANKTTTV